MRICSLFFFGDSAPLSRDSGAMPLGHDQPEIRVVALRKPIAGAAAAACPPVRLRLFAEQRLGARLGKFEFAHASPAVYQDRMGNRSRS